MECGSITHSVKETRQQKEQVQIEKKLKRGIGNVGGLHRIEGLWNLFELWYIFPIFQLQQKMHWKSLILQTEISKRHGCVKYFDRKTFREKSTHFPFIRWLSFLTPLFIANWQDVYMIKFCQIPSLPYEFNLQQSRQIRQMSINCLSTKLY